MPAAVPSTVKVTIDVSVHSSAAVELVLRILEWWWLGGGLGDVGLWIVDCGLWTVDWWLTTRGVDLHMGLALGAGSSAGSRE